MASIGCVHACLKHLTSPDCALLKLCCPRSQHFQMVLSSSQSFRDDIWASKSNYEHSRNRQNDYSSCACNILASRSQQKSLFTMPSRGLHSTSSLNCEGDKKIEGFHMYIPNPFKWLSNWLIIQEFQSSWDPSFDVKAFKFGVKQAVVRVSELVRAREWGELKGLVSQPIIDDFRLLRSPITQEQIDALDLQLKNILAVHIDGIRMQQVVGCIGTTRAAACRPGA
ncbi:uncharacterized protein LOC108664612 isoform X4 [Hyalella azteca]|uniref:Uncharacterized protein LOC108664612 isoform X4 n=1 Tax=Hyalella azteca TaxID=294128 RepID=A0A979FWS8_HYAAZ|nr:uncharacterized protein LOC108664612 isoform X4 [Hyalella azteca]